MGRVDLGVGVGVWGGETREHSEQRGNFRKIGGDALMRWPVGTGEAAEGRQAKRGALLFSPLRPLFSWFVRLQIAICNEGAALPRVFGSAGDGSHRHAGRDGNGKKPAGITCSISYP
jgi:hypothetical protein